MEVLQVQPSSYGGVEDFVDSYFRRTPTDLTYENTKYNTYYPINSISGPGVNQINFFLPKWSGRVMTDLSETFIAAKIKLTTEAGETVPDGSVVAPINNVLYSAFSECRIYFNNVLVTPNGMNFGFKQLLDTMVSFNENCKASVLQAAGYYEDVPGLQDNLTKANSGFWSRMTRFCDVESTTNKTKNWHSSWFIGRLGCDIDHSIISGVDIRLEFTLQEPKFFLMTMPNKKFKFEMENMLVMAPARTLTPLVMEKMEQRFTTKDMILSFRRKEVVPFTIPSNCKQFLSDQLFPSQMLVPSRCMMVLIHESAYTGNFQINPYNFRQKFAGGVKLVDTKLTLNGNTIDGLIIEDSRECDFIKYYLYNGQLNTGYSSSLSLEAFMKGTNKVANVEMWPILRNLPVICSFLCFLFRIVHHCF